MLAVDVRVEPVAMSVVGLGRTGARAAQLEPAPRTRTPGEVITHVAESAAAAHRRAGASRPRARGISVPGVVRRDDGWVHEAPNLGWRDVALGARLGSVLRLPVQVGERRRAGRAGRARARGRARGDRPRLRLGGLRRRRRRHLRGAAVARARGYVGEIGHLAVRPDGRPCYCGVARLLGDRGRRGGAAPRAGPAGRACRAECVVAELRALGDGAGRGRARGPARRSSPSGSPPGWSRWSTCSRRELVVLGDLFTALPPLRRRRRARDGARAEPREPGGRRDPDRDQPAGPRREAGGGGGAGLRAGAGGGVSAAGRTKAASARVSRANAASGHRGSGGVQGEGIARSPRRSRGGQEWRGRSR